MGYRKGETVRADVLAWATTRARLRDADHTWQTDAACPTEVGVNFFPEVGESTRPAKEVCHRCPVRERCLEYAMANGEKFGVWGGLSEKERRALRRLRAQGIEAA